jgi:hypothetical protein
VSCTFIQFLTVKLPPHLTKSIEEQFEPRRPIALTEIELPLLKAPNAEHAAECFICPSIDR